MYATCDGIHRGCLPASWLVSGAGYLVDGTIYFTGTAAVYGSVCAAPFLLSGMPGGYFGSELFYSCLRSIKPHVNEKYWDTDLGPAAYKGTKSWRCPQQWHLGL